MSPPVFQSYIPSRQDILFARKATKGIVEHDFVIKKIPFKMVDVGGQRSQRQKWFQCFDGITSILFMVSSSEYDQVYKHDRGKRHEGIHVLMMRLNEKNDLRCFLRYQEWDDGYCRSSHFGSFYQGLPQLFGREFYTGSLPDTTLYFIQAGDRHRET